MYNLDSGYGRMLVNQISAAIGPVFGRVFVVVNASDPSVNRDMLRQMFRPDPKGKLRFFETIAAAYAAVTDNANDVILISSYSEFDEATLTVAKSRVHFIGMDGGGRKNSQGAKWATPATDVAASTAVVINTGTRNTFKNIKFIQQGLNAAQVNAFVDQGEGTYVENCHFSHISLLSTATVSPLKFAGDTCHYKNCQIGDSTVYRTGAAQMALRLAQYARYSYFEDCEFVNASSQTSAMLVGTDAATAVIGWVKFTRCAFNGAKLADGATAGALPAVAVVSALSSGYILLDKCAGFNITLMSSVHASIINAAPVSVAAAAGGLGIAGA